MTRATPLLAAVLALGAVAPAGAQEPEPPSPVAFWNAVGDSTLRRLVAEAVEGSPDVQVALARVSGARADRFGSALDFAPTITAIGGYTRTRYAAANIPGATSAAPDLDLWDAGLQLTWELDLFGRLRRNYAGQGALLASAREDLRDVQVLLAAEVAAAWFDLLGAEERLAVARGNAENQQRTLDLTLTRLEAGRGNAFDTERARAQLSTTLSAVPALETAVAALRHRIGVLVGRPPAAVAAELTAAPRLPTLPESLVVANPDSLLRLRPDVRSAERQLAARKAFVGSAKAEYLPRLSLEGSAGYTGTTFDSLGEEPTGRYAIGPVISWPALNLGRVKARVDLARAGEAEAGARYTQAILRAEEEVETALVSYRKAQERLARLGESAGASERAAEFARLRFVEGASDFLQVLDAERTLLEAQDRLASGRADAATALVGVYRALGGAGI
ncbi:MAG TPA: TolC family protein [Gemmatimonadales bacterium]|nr:TolC family protein [Gemmatimonadales bacterium]